MKLLIDYCNTSTDNIFMILLIGAVLFIVSSALDNTQSNGIELCLSGLGKVSSYVMLVVSVTALFFAGKSYVTKELKIYDQACKANAIETLGGQEHLENIGDTMKALTGDEQFDLMDMESTKDKVGNMVIALNEEEMQLLAMGGID